MSNVNKSYIMMLSDVMKKKDKVLGELILATMKQHGCFQNNSMDEESYETLFNEKMSLLKQLNDLDEGFETMYAKIGDELKNNRYAYESEILAMQQLIRVITDKSIRLKQLEAENKLLFDGYINSQKKKVKDYKVSKKTAAVYYKNMMKQFNNEGIFYNRTK